MVEAGENSYFAQYGTSESWGKWAPDQQLVFYEEAAPLSVADSAVATAYEEETVSMLGAGAILAPMISGGGGGAALAAGGVVAGAAILGGGGDGGGGTTEPKPQEPAKAPATVVDTDVTIGGDNTTEKDETVTITGTGEPGAQVEVEVNGKTETATVDPDGNWSTTFTGPTYPGEGNHTVTVTVTDPDGQVTELAGPDITIDTTPPELDFTAGVVSTSDLHNQTGHNSGTSIGGKGEPGASVAVTIEGVTHTTTVDGNGDWSVTFDKSELEGGTYTVPVTIVTTDGFGNSATHTDNVQIDTEITASINGGLSGGDNVVNLTESGSTVAVGGTADPFSAITMVANGYIYTATTDANGNWSVNIPQGNLPTGETSVKLDITATDPAGNVTTGTGSLGIDTVINAGINGGLSGGDNTVNLVESGSTVAVNGTADPFSSITFEANGHTYTTTADQNGNWTVPVPKGNLPTGETTVDMKVTAKDTAGNVATNTGVLDIDTFVNTLNVTSDSSGSDSWVNASEMANGLVLGGRVEAGSQSVRIEHNGTFYNATVDAAGNWTATVPSSAVGQGSFGYTVHAVDGAGNTRELDASVMIDTQAPDAANIIRETTEFSTNDNFLKSLDLKDDGDTYTLYTVDQNGTVTEPLQIAEDRDANGITRLVDEVQISVADGAVVLDGRSLVVTAEDQAGNVTGTYFAWNQTGTYDVASEDLMNTGLNIESMNLRDADVNLTLTEAQIKALSENSDQVTILGDAADSVTLEGAEFKETYTDAQGHNFGVYTLGDATVLIDEDIQNVII